MRYRCMRYCCRFASVFARIGFDAGISGNTPCGSPKPAGLNDVTRAQWGRPRAPELWEPT